VEKEDVNNLIGVFIMITFLLKYLYHFEYLRKIRKHLAAQNFISFIFRIENVGYYFLVVMPVFWSLSDDQAGELEKKRVKLFVMVFWILMAIEIFIAFQNPRFN
jgi:ABC-type transport system involved in cytochrome bd biosynthesis fused ATPase/permease subunit